MNETKKSPVILISAIILTIAAVFNVFRLLGALGYLNFFATFLNIVSIAGTIILAIALYQNKPDILAVVGFGLLAFTAVISFLTGFFNGNYFEYNYTSYLLKTTERSFAPLYIFPYLVQLAGYVGCLGIAAMFVMNLFPQYKEQVKKLWFVPAVCLIARELLIPIIGVFIDFGYVGFSFLGFLSAVATFVATTWLAYPEGHPVLSIGTNTSYSTATDAYGTYTSAPAPQIDGFCSLVKHIVLLLFTFGIWNLIWIYRTTIYLNRVKDEPQRNQTTELLLCMFVPFYNLFWIYKSAQRIDKLANEKGIQSDLTMICLILAIFVGIVPPIIMQDKINVIVTATPGTTTAYTDAPTPAPAVDVPEELKKYKELLDSGIITQEEFDAKKKQLLEI